jgi:hypothetical protein
MLTIAFAQRGSDEIKSIKSSQFGLCIKLCDETRQEKEPQTYSVSIFSNTLLQMFMSFPMYEM